MADSLSPGKSFWLGLPVPWILNGLVVALLVQLSPRQTPAFHQNAWIALQYFDLDMVTIVFLIDLVLLPVSWLVLRSIFADKEFGKGFLVGYLFWFVVTCGACFGNPSHLNLH